MAADVRDRCDEPCRVRAAFVHPRGNDAAAEECGQRSRLRQCIIRFQRSLIHRCYPLLRTRLTRGVRRGVGVGGPDNCFAPIAATVFART